MAGRGRRSCRSDGRYPRCAVAQFVAEHRSDRRLAHPVSVGLLMKVFPPQVVGEAIAECGRTEQRRRSLRARSMANFSIGMALHSEGSYEDVLALISDGAAWVDRLNDEQVRLASKPAISYARERLGPEPMALLFDRVACPLASKARQGCWRAGRRLVAVDGTCRDWPTRRRTTGSSVGPE